MADTPPSSTGTLSDLLLRWRELRERGVEASPEQLCHEHPDLVSDLRGHINAIKSMERLLLPSDRVTKPMDGAVPESIPIAPTIVGYEILGELGRGGMGVVYKAIQKNLNRPVALKMILSGAHAGPNQLARFKGEAEALARLRHPNIVQVHEAGESNGLLYLSLEFVEGGGLDRHLDGKALPPQEAAALVETLARAIQVAHDTGIVHRDLKPANILLAACGLAESAKPQAAIPKITDFGLAKMSGSEGQTHSGAVLGTPQYMAPEQAEGRVKQIGPPADVYSLGAILYECLTGQPPFRGETILETIRQVTSTEPIPPTRLVRQVPRDLETICLKCLRKEPSSRYKNAESLADDLRRFLDGRPITARPVSLAERAVKWLRRRPERLILVALFLLAFPLIALVLWPDPEEKPDPTLATQARQIMHKYCFHCHGQDPNMLEGDLAILDRDMLLQLKVVVPGDIKSSRLIERIEDNSMPPVENEEYPRLSSDEIEVLKRWIKADAPAFEGPTPEEMLPPPPASPLAVAARDLLKTHCYECHSFRTAKSGIKILNHDLLVEKRKLVLPKMVEDSPLWKSLVAEKKVMPPPPKKRLTADQLDIVRRWIEAGAPAFPLTQEN